MGEVANANHLWEAGSSAVYDRPHIPTDCEFLSQHIIVGNIEPDFLEEVGDSSHLESMLRRVDEYGPQNCRLDEEYLAGVLANLKPLRPQGLGLHDSKAIRSQLILRLVSH